MFKRSIDFSPSITLTTMQTWDALVTYPGSNIPAVEYRGWDIVKLRNHIFETHPEYLAADYVKPVVTVYRHRIQ